MDSVKDQDANCLHLINGEAWAEEGQGPGKELVQGQGLEPGSPH